MRTIIYSFTAGDAECQKLLAVLEMFKKCGFPAKVAMITHIS
jgi:hypothetical protein